MSSDVNPHLALDLRAKVLLEMCFGESSNKPIEEHDGDNDDADGVRAVRA